MVEIKVGNAYKRRHASRTGPVRTSTGHVHTYQAQVPFALGDTYARTKVSAGAGSQTIAELLSATYTTPIAQHVTILDDSWVIAV